MGIEEKIRANWLAIVVFGLVGVLISVHLVLISKTFVIDAQGNIRTAIAGYGDIPLHLTQISKFAFNNMFDLSEPIFYNAELQYPFIINLISAIFVRLFGSLRFGTLFPIMALVIANIILVFILFKNFLKNSLLALLALYTFFLGSGFGAYSYIVQAVKSGDSIGQFFNYLTVKNISMISKWDAVYPKQNIDFGAPLSLVFLHQRPFFLGLFVFLLFLFLLLKIHRTQDRKHLIWAGILLGILPIVHTHSFVAASLVMLVFLILEFTNRGFSYLKRFSLIFWVSIPLALIQLLYLLGNKTGFHSGGSFLHFRLGWMVQPTIGSIKFAVGLPRILSLEFLKFNWVNFGVILPVFLVSLIFIFRSKFKTVLSSAWSNVFFALCAAGLFLAGQIVRFQPWDYDNNKILVYFQFFAAPLAIWVLAKLIKSRKALGIAAMVLFLALSLTSGILDIAPRLKVKKENIPVIFNVNAQGLAGFVLNNIPANQLILTGTTHLNLISSLAGRSVLVGYPGWLWTRGINYQEREADVKRFYSDPMANKDIIYKYGVSYVLFDPQARYDFKADQKVFDAEFSKIYSNSEYALYKIK